MSAAEFAFWQEFRTRHGFPTDRIVAASALAGTAANRAMGGKVKPADLIPQFGASQANKARLLAWAMAGKGSKVVKKRAATSLSA